MEATLTSEVTTDVLPSWLHWGEPQQLDDMLGWRRARASPWTHQGKAKVSQQCAQFIGRYTASDTTLAFPRTADRLPNGGWPPHGHIFRTCYLTCTDQVFHNVIIRGDLHNSPFVDTKYPNQSLQLRLGKYGLRPLRYRGIWLDDGSGSTVQYTSCAIIPNVSEHGSVSKVVHVFEAEPSDTTEGFCLEKLHTNGRLSPKIVFPSGHRDQLLGPLYSDDLHFTSCWNNNEQALCVETGGGDIGVWFPWRWSIPPYTSHNNYRNSMTTFSQRNTFELIAAIPQDLRQTVLFPMFDAADLEVMRTACRQFDHSSGAAKELAIDIRRLQLQPVAIIDLSFRLLSLPGDVIGKTFENFRIFVPDVTLQSWRRGLLLEQQSAKPAHWGVTLVSTSCHVVTTFQYMGIYSMQLGVGQVSVHASLSSPDFVPPNTFRCHIWQTRYAIKIPGEHVPFRHQIWSVTMNPNGTSGYGNLPTLSWPISMLALSQAPSPFVDSSRSDHMPHNSWTQPNRVVFTNLSKSSLWTKPIIMGLYPTSCTSTTVSTSTTVHSSTSRDIDSVVDSDESSIDEEEDPSDLMQM